MDQIKNITTPLTEETVKNLHAGDFVRITGPIYTARDAAHKRMYEALERGEGLPFDIKDQVIYYVGPTPAKPGEVVGSAGPTTSGRMDKYTPAMVEQGMKGMIGKGFRNNAVVEACKKGHAIYFVAVGGPCRNFPVDPERRDDCLRRPGARSDSLLSGSGFPRHCRDRYRRQRCI